MLAFTCPPNMSAEEWFAMEDFREYLLTSTRGEIPLYYSGNPLVERLFLASILLPRRLVHKRQLAELSRWNFNPAERSWGWGSDFDPHGRKRRRLYKPFEEQTPKVLQQGIPLVTHRKNECVKNGAHYFELNQQISHVHGLHWMEERSAYCTLDELGDIRDVVKVAIESWPWTVSIAEDMLWTHLLIGDFVLVRFFDVDRGTWTMVPPLPTEEDFAAAVRWGEGAIYAQWTPVKGGGEVVRRAFLRGFQLIRPPADRRVRRALLEGEKPRQYCTYIAHDWKHGRIAEVSCNPKKLSNYFVSSPFPFEISPAFFRREVLLKYQSNIDKYIVHEGYIRCHGAWSLRYDINERDQVHVYLIDLAYLPYAEQLHWKSFNEDPKAGISSRAYTADFLGEFYTLAPEPLRDLKRLLTQFPSARTPEGSAEVWQQPCGADADLMYHVHYMAGTSSSEWGTEIISLDKLVVEGLREAYLRRLAGVLGVEPQKLHQLRSIGLLEEISQARNIAPDIIRSVVDPLRELQLLRSKLGSHRRGQEAEQMEQQLRRQHKGLAAHYRDLVKRVSQAMLTLADLINHGLFNAS